MLEGLRKLFAPALRTRNRVRHGLPRRECCDDWSNLGLKAGSIGRNELGEIEGSFDVECLACGGRHTAHLSGENARGMFLVLQEQGACPHSR